MIKILHSADWHLDSPIQGRSEAQTRLLRKALLELPGKIARICREEQCDLVLLAGDLFDGPYTQDGYYALRDALDTMDVPVFITPGNHDFASSESPWLTRSWPENVHIFTRPVIESVTLPALDATVYGAGFTCMDCPGLMKDFQAQTGSAWQIGILHGDPTQVSSPYCPITRAQVKASGLHYLALGHIHKGGSFRAGDTLCAWPGCPMGRGYDEDGEKGLLITELAETVSTRFIPLDTPRFYDLEAEALEDAAAAVSALLPPLGNEDLYRITLVGPSAPVDLPALRERFAHFPHLELRDRTTAPIDIWEKAGEDSFEGLYFSLLKDSLTGKTPEEQAIIRLAARISRQILENQEVHLP